MGQAHIIYWERKAHPLTVCPSCRSSTESMPGLGAPFSAATSDGRRLSSSRPWLRPCTHTNTSNLKKKYGTVFPHDNPWLLSVLTVLRWLHVMERTRLQS